jgi:hypothetical protein
MKPDDDALCEELARHLVAEIGSRDALMRLLKEVKHLNRLGVWMVRLAFEEWAPSKHPRNRPCKRAHARPDTNGFTLYADKQEMRLDEAVAVYYHLAKSVGRKGMYKQKEWLLNFISERYCRFSVDQLRVAVDRSSKKTSKK